ncbi:hypothetical protein CEXT_317571 [Caerostris extrusa]|uniref:Uncharacterized protein n=1 Tax=Caerostris extrusa TaxID=172846 RepID=A0AAV4QWU5_CAEEX|nr:hypothetical protein CEXT_317571 [Caerostris extrusa]
MGNLSDKREEKGLKDKDIVFSFSQIKGIRSIGPLRIYSDGGFRIPRFPYKFFFRSDSIYSTVKTLCIPNRLLVEWEGGTGSPLWGMKCQLSSPFLLSSFFFFFCTWIVDYR